MLWRISTSNVISIPFLLFSLSACFSFGESDPLPLTKSVNAIAVATDGSGDIYVGGEFSSDLATQNRERITRLNSDATTDLGFATGIGFPGLGSTVNAIVPLTDGSGDIYVGGLFEGYEDYTSRGVVRIHGDGTSDSTFFARTQNSIRVGVIALVGDGSGDIYIGESPPYPYELQDRRRASCVQRINSDGSVDGGFTPGLCVDSDDVFYGIYAIVPTDDGSGDIYVAGDFASYNGVNSQIVRLNSDGTVDDTFAVNWLAPSEIILAAGPVADGSGRVIVSGIIANSASRWLGHTLARLNVDGTPDATFAIGVVGGGVFTIVPAADGSGDIYVGGAFTSYNDVPCAQVIRLHSDGTVDDSFSVDMALYSEGRYDYPIVKTIALVNDGTGDIYIGGEFDGYGNTASKYLIRLNSDGSIDAGFDTAALTLF